MMENNVNEESRPNYGTSDVQAILEKPDSRTLTYGKTHQDSIYYKN